MTSTFGTSAQSSVAASPASAFLASTYDRLAVTSGVVHFGLGNFHRAHRAIYLDRLMSEGEALDWGICGVGATLSDKRTRDVMQNQDDLHTLVLKHLDRTPEPKVVGSIHEYLYAPDNPSKALDKMADAGTRIVSLTVTKGGYNIDDATDEFNTESPATKHDAEYPDKPITAFGFIVEALRRRRDAGIPPFTVTSCDNLPGSGSIAKAAVFAQAKLTDLELEAWIRASVAFPNGMVDRITPVTTPEDVEMVRERYGIEGVWPVTAEPLAQWVLEDKFILRRPPFKDAGVQLIDDVALYELTKLRLLNASHQPLAHWGRLFGLEFAHDAAADPDVAAFTRACLGGEALETLLLVSGINLPQYVDTLFERFTNASIADTLARLAQDASDRVPKFVLSTVRDNLKESHSIKLGTAMCAVWALGMGGKAEDDSEIVVDDQQGNRLVVLATRERDGEDTAVVSDKAVFGELGSDPRFVEAFMEALRTTRADDARAAMKHLVAED